MKKAILIALLMLTGASLSFAQTRVTGRVTAKDDGQPISFATVSVKGHTVATTTNDAGEYSINVPAGATTLTVSFIGMTSQDVTIGGRDVINVTLEPEGEMLTESVVTAMGIKKEKKALGYAVQDIKAEELMKNKSANVINSLSGKIAGVNITQGGGAAGSGSSIVIRGGTSLERDNQPLFVVDGIIYDNGTSTSGDSGFDGTQRTSTSYGNRIMDINPEDIENMSVLKGPAAAALYGSRASAGAIVITTKKGSEGSVRVNFSTKLSVSWVNRLPEEQKQYKRGYYNTSGNLDDFTQGSWGAPFGPSDTQYDNIKDFFETATTWDNNASISGGNKNGSFFLSLSNYDQSGIIPGTGYKKNTFRFNGEQKYGHLTVGANVAYSVADTDKTLTSAGLWGSSGAGAMEALYGSSRSDDLTYYVNPDGTRYRMFEGRQKIEEDTDNPYWTINKNKLRDKTNRFTGGVTFSYKVADWMNINYRAGMDRYSIDDYKFIHPGGGVKVLWQNGMLSDATNTYEYLSSNFMMDFNKKFGKFDFNLLLGNTLEDTKNVRDSRMGYNFVIDNFYSFGNILDTNKKFDQVYSRNRMVGLYGEYRMSYNSMLYLTFTGRNDWTSTLPIDNRSYFYPSVSGSFVFTELLPKNTVLTFGKLRASWAKVGKDTNPYLTYTALWKPRTFLGGTGVSNNWTRGNNELGPEITTSTEVGLELRFLGGRLGLDYAYYTQNSTDQLLQPRVSQATGYILYMMNIGDVKNKGMEIAINGTPIKTKDFTWDVTLNMSGNRGKVENLKGGLDVLYVTDVQVGNAKAASFNGGNFMAISGSKWNRDENGNVILDAKTGMPTSDNLTTHEIGNREPKFTGGLNNSFQYKNWNLSFLVDFRKGGDIYNGTEYFMTRRGTSKKSLEARDRLEIKGVVKNAAGGYDDKVFVFEGDKFYNGVNEVAASDPKAQSGRNIIMKYWDEQYYKESANFMTDTNWLRLRSVSLSYTMPESILSKTKFIKGITATVTGNNLLLWTNYKGLDPETSAAGSGVVGSGSVGIDYCGVPATAGVSFGLSFTF